MWDQVAANLTELGELNDADFKVEGYQRNPEKGEEESRKAKRERESVRVEIQMSHLWVRRLVEK